ncbi:uncharacterized protein LOC144106438 [Amblyomma americanum]
MADNEEHKSEGMEQNEGDGVGSGKEASTDDGASKSAREALGKSKSMPELEHSSGRNNTRISQSESSFVASLKQRSIEPEEHEVRRFGEVKLVRTLSQLVGSEHSFVEDDGAEDAGEQQEETPVGDTMSYMDFPSTIGTDTKLDAELRHPVRSAETVGEGKTDERLLVTRLQGEATVAPTTLESSVGEPQIAKVPSDLQTDKKPISAGTEEVTAYTSFSDSLIARPVFESTTAPIQGEGAEEETSKPVPGTSRPEVAQLAEEEMQKPVPFKTPEETTAGSEVEDTLVERAGLGKHIEEPASKTMTRVDTIKPRGDWEGPAGEKPAEETTLAKQPPKRRVSTQVSESQASEWRIIERLPPYDATKEAEGYERKPEELGGKQLAHGEQPTGTIVEREDHDLIPTDTAEVTGTVLQLAMEVDIELTATETTEKTEKTAVDTTLREQQAKEERAAEEYPGITVAIEFSTAGKQTYVETTPVIEYYPQETPPVPLYVETTPYTEAYTPESGVKAARSLTMVILPEKEKELEELPKAETAAPSLDALKKRRRSSIMPPTSALVPGYRGKTEEALAAVEAAEAAAVQEPSYLETTPALESYPQEAPPVPSYVETAPYIESCTPESGVKKARSLTMMVLPEKEKELEELPKAEPAAPSLDALKKRRRSSIMPPTSALVPWYRGEPEKAPAAVEAAEEAAVKEPSYIETTPAMESYPQEAPPVPSYVETTPYIESCTPESGVKAARSLTMMVLPEKEKELEELPKAEPAASSLDALKKRRRSSIMPPTSALVPGYRGKTEEAPAAVEAAEAAAVQEPSYIETTPAMESYPQEAPPVPSYVETTPFIESCTPESGVKAARSLTMMVQPEKELEELPKAEPAAPSLDALKKRRRSSIMPPTSALVPGYRGKTEEAPAAVEAAEAAAVQEPSYIETTPAMESYPQEAPPVPSYVESTPFIESCTPESGVKAARSLTMMVLPEKEKELEELPKAEPAAPSLDALKKRRRSSIMPPTSALVPGYRGKTEEAPAAVEAAEAAAVQEPSYIETTPAMESYPQEAPPVPSYVETTPFIESCTPESGVKAARSLTKMVLPEKEKELEELPKAEPAAPSLDALKKRRRSSIMPPTSALVPWYRGEPEKAPAAVEAAEEAAVKEPSYIETTPAMESYPQEARPVPSYIETTPYLETYTPEIPVGIRDIRREIQARTVVLEDITKEGLPSASTAPEAVSSKMRRRSSVVPPTSALVPWYSGKEQMVERLEHPPADYKAKEAPADAEVAAVQEPSYTETTPAMESYPQETPLVPSYVETTPYIESCTPESGLKAARSLTMMVLPEKEKELEELPKAELAAPSPDALKKRRRSSIMPPTSALVPGYRGKSEEAPVAVEAAEAPAIQEPSYIETTPAMEIYQQEAPPVPSYIETTPYIEVCTPESGIKPARSLTMVVLPEKEKELEELPKAELAAPSPDALMKRRRSSIMPPTSALVPGYRGKSEEAPVAVKAAEAPAVQEESYIETTPVLEIFPQEAPPVPSYSETTPFVESFLPDVSASEAVDSEKSTPGARTVILRADATEEKAVAVSEPSKSAAIKMRRRSSVVPPTSALVPWYFGKVETVERLEHPPAQYKPEELAGADMATAKEPSYEETTPALYSYPQEAPQLPSYAERVAYTEARFSESSLAGPPDLEQATQGTELPIADARMERAVVEVMSFSIEELSPGEIKPAAGVDHEEREGRVVPAFTSDESREIAVHGGSVIADVAAKNKLDDGGIFAHTSYQGTPKRSRQYSDLTGVRMPQVPPPQEGQTVTVTVPDFDAEAANEEQGSSLGSHSSQEDEAVSKMAKKEKVALTLYDDTAATAALEAKQREEERRAKEQAFITSATITPEVKESQPFVPTTVQSASLIEAAQTVSHVPEIAVPEAVPKVEVLPGAELQPPVEVAVSGETAVQEWKPAPVDIVKDIQRPLEEEKPCAPGGPIQAEKLDEGRVKPEGVPGPSGLGVPVTVLRPTHDIPLRVFAGKPIFTQPLTSIPPGATERVIRVSAPWATGLSPMKAAEAARGRFEWEKELGRATGTDRRIERLHEKKTAKYSVVLKDGQPVASFSSSSEVTEPVKDEGLEGLAYQYVASEEQVLERIVTLDGPSTTAPGPQLDDTDGRPPGADSSGLASDDHSTTPDTDRTSPKHAEEPYSETTATESQTSPKEATLFVQHPTEHAAPPSQPAAPKIKQGSSFDIGTPIDEQTESFAMKDDSTKEEQPTEEVGTDAGFEEFTAGREQKLPDLATSGAEPPAILHSGKQVESSEKVSSTSKVPVYLTEVVSVAPTKFSRVKGDTSQHAPENKPFESKESTETLEEKADILATERIGQESSDYIEPSKVIVEEIREKLDSGAEPHQMEHSVSETNNGQLPFASAPAGASPIAETKTEALEDKEERLQIEYHPPLLAPEGTRECSTGVASEIGSQPVQVSTAAVMGSKTMETASGKKGEQAEKYTLLAEPKVSESETKEAPAVRSLESVTEPALHMSPVPRPETLPETAVGQQVSADVSAKPTDEPLPMVEQDILQVLSTHAISEPPHSADTKEISALSETVAVPPVTPTLTSPKPVSVLEIPTQRTPEVEQRSLVEFQGPGRVAILTQVMPQTTVPCAQELATDVLEVKPEPVAMEAKIDQNMIPGSKFEGLEQPGTKKMATQEASLVATTTTEQEDIEQLQVAKPSEMVAPAESEAMLPADRAAAQAWQVIETPTTEVRSAGDFSSDGAAVLVEVEDVDEAHEYNEEVREKRSASVASLLKESPAEIVAQLNVASTKPASPAERVVESALEPRFRTPPSEQELDRNILAGAISDLSTLPEEATRSLTDATEAATAVLPAVEPLGASDLGLTLLEAHPFLEAYPVERAAYEVAAEPAASVEAALETVTEVAVSETKPADAPIEILQGKLKVADIAEPPAVDEKAPVQPPALEMASDAQPVIERAPQPVVHAAESALSAAVTEAPMVSAHQVQIPEGFKAEVSTAVVPTHPSLEKPGTMVVAVREGPAEKLTAAQIVPEALALTQHVVEQPLPRTPTTPYLVSGEPSTTVRATAEILGTKIATEGSEQALSPIEQAVEGASGVACVDSTPLALEDYKDLVKKAPLQAEVLPEKAFEIVDREVLVLSETLPSTVTDVVPKTTVNLLEVTNQENSQVVQPSVPHEAPEEFQPAYISRQITREVAQPEAVELPEVLPETTEQLLPVPEATADMPVAAKHEEPQVVQPSMPHEPPGEAPKELQPAHIAKEITREEAQPGAVQLPEALPETTAEVLPVPQATADMATKHEEPQVVQPYMPHEPPGETPKELQPAHIAKQITREVAQPGAAELPEALPETTAQVLPVPEATADMPVATEHEEPQVVQPSMPHEPPGEAPKELQPAHIAEQITREVAQPGAVELPEALPETTAEVLPMPEATADMPVAAKHEEPQVVQPAMPHEPPGGAPKELQPAHIAKEITREEAQPGAVQLPEALPETTAEVLQVPQATADMATKHEEPQVVQPSMPHEPTGEAPKELEPAHIAKQITREVAQPGAALLEALPETTEQVLPVPEATADMPVAAKHEEPQVVQPSMPHEPPGEAPKELQLAHIAKQITREVAQPGAVRLPEALPETTAEVLPMPEATADVPVAAKHEEPQVVQPPMPHAPPGEAPKELQPAHIAKQITCEVAQPGAVELPEALPETTAEVLPVPQATADMPVAAKHEELQVVQPSMPHEPPGEAPKELQPAHIAKQITREVAQPGAVELPEALPETTAEVLPVPQATADMPVATKHEEPQVVQPPMPHEPPGEAPKELQPAHIAKQITRQVAQPGAVELPEVLPETTAEVLPVPKAAADLPAPLTTPLTDAPEKLLHATLTQVARELEPPAAVELTKVQPETTTEALAVPQATADRPVASKQGEEPVAQPCVPCKAPEVILLASIIDEMAPAVKQTATSPQLHSHSEVTSLIPAYPAESNFKVVKEEAGAPVTQEAIANQPEVFQEVVASSEKGVAKPNGLLIPLVTSETGMGIAAEAPGVTQSELAIAEALRESREEALKREGQEALLLEGIVAEVLLPELEEHEAEAASLETLARPLISERDLDQAQISGTSLPPIEPVTYADFQQSLKAPAGSLQSKTTDLVLVRLTPDYTASLPGADAKQLYLEGGEKIDTPIATASHRGAVEKEEEISQLAAAAIAVAEAAVIMEAQESQRCMPAEPSMTGSIVTAVSEFPVVLAVADANISQEIREKIADDIEMRPSVSRTALVAVIADERHEQPDAPCAALGAPSVTTTSSSAEDRSRPQQDQAEPSDGLQVPEPLVPALDDEIHAPMPTSFNVPVINIQYNFHFPAPGAPGPSGQQPPPSPEQAMAAQVLQGALAQQGIAGHIPGHHVLTPEQQAVRHMTERLNDIASRGTEPYTGRQSPARGTFFRQLPRKPVTPVPPLQPPPRASASQESRRRCGVRAVVFLLAFLMLIFIMLYALGLFGKKRYFMYYG